MLSHSVISDTLCGPMGCSPPGSIVHGDSPGKHTGVGCHALLQGIFPTHGLNPGLPGGFFTILATREVQSIYSVYLWSVEIKVIPIKKQFAVIICVNWIQTLYVKLRSMTSILIQNYVILKTEEQLYNAQCINKELSLGKEEMRNKARLWCS